MERCLPDGFALGEGVNVCGLGGVEGKFLKAMVEKHLTVGCGLARASHIAANYSVNRGTTKQSDAQHVYHKQLFVKLQSAPSSFNVALSFACL